MTATLAPRAVLVHRRTELADLLARHGTRGQAEFYLAQRGRRLDDVVSRSTGGAARWNGRTSPGSCSHRATS